MRGIKDNRVSTIQLIMLYVLIALAVAMVLTTVLRGRISDMMISEMQSGMINVVEQDRFLLKEKFNSIAANLNAISSDIASKGIHNFQYDEDVLQGEMRNYRFSSIGVVDISGNALLGPDINMGNFSGICDSLYGKRRAVYAISTTPGDRRAMVVSWPIMRDNLVTGVVYGIYNEDDLHDLFSIPSFDGVSDSMVINSDGDVLVSVNDQELAKQLRFALNGWQNTFSPSAQQRLFTKVKQNGSGVERIALSDGSQYFLACMPINEIDDLYIVGTMPVSKVEERIGKQLDVITAVLGTLLIVLLLLYSYQTYSKRKQEERLERLAFVDDLTGLGNKAAYVRTLYSYYKDNGRNGQAISIASIDIDNMKACNEIMGFSYGDEMIKRFGIYLSEPLADGEECFRVGGDIFYLILKSQGLQSDGNRLRKLIDDVTARIKAEEHYILTASAGVYQVPDATREDERIPSPMECGDNADFARKKAKGKTTNIVCCFDSALIEDMMEVKALEDSFSSALDNNEFVMYYQPKYNIQGPEPILAGAEALVRWIHPKKGFLNPGVFLSLFERDGNSKMLDMHIIEKVCHQISIWRKNGYQVPTISINLSRQTLMLGDLLINELELLMEYYDIPRKLIQLEILEGSFGEKAEDMLAILKTLKKRGFSVAMDDFGSGYSSLGLLNEMPLDCVKLDRSLFTSWTDEVDEVATALVKFTIQVLKLHGREVVAEGIEEKYQVDILKEFGCDLIQGYYFSKPLPVDSFEEKMNKA